jgi:hypothetical protein
MMPSFGELSAGNNLEILSFPFREIFKQERPFLSM